MKNIKKYIILLISMIIIIVIALLCLFNLPTEEEKDIPDEIGSEYEYAVNSQYKLVSSWSDYFTVKNIVTLFYDFIADINGEIEEPLVLEIEEGTDYNAINTEQYAMKEKEKTKNALLGMLGEEYIHEFSVSTGNIQTTLEKYYVKDFIINHIHSVDTSKNVTLYFAQVCQIKEKALEDINLIIARDKENNTFSIYLEDYAKAHALDNIKEGQQINSTIEKVKNTNYNTITFEVANDSKIITEYFARYQKMLQYAPEKLYENLQEEYRNKKFASKEDFTQYVANRKSELLAKRVTKYDKTVDATTTQYVALDQNNNYTIFCQTAPMQYSVILDTYTIDLPEFTEQYQKASEENKVLMNIQRFFDAINDKDYRYAYSKLDTTFKNNHFKTQVEFEDYITKNFFAQNKLSAGKVEKQNEVYLCNITVSDATGKDTKTTTKSFVMQLKQAADFVMSLSV